MLKIRKYHYSGYVYDLTTEQHHNFFADGINIHNCAKKRYILNVFDNEGVRYSEPKLKIMGIEAIKSSTPASCREALKDAFKIIISGSEEEVRKHIDKFKTEFFSLSPEEISFPRGVSDIEKWTDRATKYKKGTPIHVRGSILFNGLIKEFNLNKKYTQIQSGDKIKFCYLKMPNPIHEDVISFIEYLPPELNLHKYIDYEKQYQKAFLDSILLILNPIGYRVEDKQTLEDFFC
jgi:DNA polymerase elongation subunit (family B)